MRHATRPTSQLSKSPGQTRGDHQTQAKTTNQSHGRNSMGKGLKEKPSEIGIDKNASENAAKTGRCLLACSMCLLSLHSKHLRTRKSRQIKREKKKRTRKGKLCIKKKKTKNKCRKSMQTPSYMSNVQQCDPPKKREMGRQTC